MVSSSQHPDYFALIYRKIPLHIVLLAFLAFTLSKFSAHGIVTAPETTPFQSDLRVLLHPSTLLHRRSTRASNAATSSNPTGANRWIPAIHPKFRSPMDGRFPHQRAIGPMQPPQHQQYFFQNNLRPRPPQQQQYMPQKPPTRLQLTRPSQPEPTPKPISQPSLLYAASEASSARERPSDVYLPVPPSNHPSDGYRPPSSPGNQPAGGYTSVPPRNQPNTDSYHQTPPGNKQNTGGYFPGPNGNHRPTESYHPLPPGNPQPPESYLPVPPSSETKTAADELVNNPSDSELRFLFHRPEDENLIKSSILKESERYNEKVTFVRGPTLKFQRRQTIYLPPKKKSVIYIMLKEPQVQTDLEVIEPQGDNTPEVNIVYEKAGGVITKHYYAAEDKPSHHPGGAVGGYGGSANGRTVSLSEFPAPQQDLTGSGSDVKSIRIQLPFVKNSTNSTFDPVIEDGKKRSFQPQVKVPVFTPNNSCQSATFSKKL